MFKVTVHNEEDNKFVPIMEYALNDIYKKLIGAKLLYGDSVIEHLIDSQQYDTLISAMNGKLDLDNIRRNKHGKRS